MCRYCLGWRFFHASVALPGSLGPDCALTACLSFLSLVQMGKVQKKLGQLHEALANFNQALDLDPKAGNTIKAHIDRLQVMIPVRDLRVRARVFPSVHAVAVCGCAEPSTRFLCASAHSSARRCRISTKTIRCCERDLRLCSAMTPERV